MTIIQPQGAIVDLETGPPGDIAFSIDSKTVYVAKGGTIGAYDAVTGIEEQSWTIGTQLGGIDVSLDGKYLVATELQVDPVNQPDTYESISDIHVYRLDLETGVSTKFTTQVEVYANPFFDVSFMPDGKALLTHPHIYAFTDTLTTLNFETGIFSAVGQDEKVYGQLSSTPDKSHFIMTPANHSGGPVFLYTAESGITAENRFVLRGNNNGAQAISPSGDMVVQGVGLNVYDGDLQLLTNLADAFPRLAFNVAGLAFSPDEDRLYLLDDKADSIYVFRTSDWSLIDSYPAGGEVKNFNALGNALIISNDGKKLALLGAENVHVVDLDLVLSDGPTSGADTLIGGIGDDYLQGFDGDDILDGGAGEDEMWGGAGDDTYYLDNRNDQVHELGDNGQDTAIISFDWPYGFTIPWQVETLVLVGPATNAFGYGGAETLIGNELDNRLSGVGGDDTLIGNGGNDELIGGAGNDRLEGGLGDDIFSVDSPADIVIELAGEGDDLINSSVSLTLPSGVERLTLASGSQTLSGTGNDLANVIIGNAGDNALSGADGDDALFGEAGHDILTGGAGNDMLDGGDGDDIAAFSGNYDDYEITQNDGSVHIIDQRVSAGDGMDTATNVEVLRFADGDYDAATGAKIGDGGGPPAAAMFSLGTGVVGDIAFSPDSKTLYTARGGTITAFDMATGSATQSWAFGTNLGGIDVSLDGKYLVATERELGPTTQLDFPYFSIEIYAYRIDLTTGISTKFTDTSSLSANYFSDVSFLPDGKALLSHFNAYGSEPFTILDFDTGTFEPNETHIGGTVIATPDKSKILLSDHQLPYALYTSADGTLEHDAEAVDFDTGFIRGISPAGNFIVQGRALNVYDANQELIASVPSDEPYLGVQVTGLAFGPAGDIAYILNRDSNTIYTLETSGWSVIGGYPVQSKPVEYPSFGNGLLASNDGRYLAAMTETGVQVIDTTLAENTAPTSGPDMLLGDSSDNYIYGFDGDDVIDGLLGRDLMIGGRGNDSYYVDQINDVILEDSDEGFDTVFVNYETYPSYTLPLWVEALTLIGSTIQASGNYQANILTGNNLDNRFFAKAGDDELIGNGGSDNLLGEAGNDALYGGADNDTLLGGPGNDFLDGGEGDDAAIFGGNRSDYLITQENGNVRFVDQRVDNSDGEDLATNIEVFHLADGDFGTTSVAINDDASATAGLSTLIDVLGNDVRAIDAVAMSVVSTGNPAHGIVTINSDESVTYTAYSGFSGTDSFEYTIMDGTGGSDTATVTVFVEAASSQSQLIAKDGFVGSLGGGGKVYGTAGLQDITILDIPGSSDLDASFNKGGSIVRLHGNASDWQIVQSGSSAIFLDGDTFVQVPAGAVGLTVVFEDGVRLLQIDLIAGTLKIGSQAFGETLVTINAPADASPIPFGADPAASATLILAPGASVTTAGKLNIFGTGSNETVHLISGDAILDASFNGGGDTLLLDPPASEFTGNQIGSTVLLDSASTDIHIPVGIEGMAIKFGESDERTLIINTVSQTIMIDMQEIGLIPVALSEFA